VAERIDESEHHWNCDLVRAVKAGRTDGECYCPTEAERAEQIRYEKNRDLEWYGEEGSGG
jgi:hypothetical protein